MDDIPAEMSGTIVVSVYKRGNNMSPLFSIKSDNEDLFDIEYIIEDVLKMY